MLKIILAVALGSILGVILLKNWRIIVDLILLVVALIFFVVAVMLSLVEFILKLPFTIFNNLTFSEEKYQKKIIALYDQIFLSDTSEKMVKQHLRNIEKFEAKLNKKEQAKKEKEIVEFLDEVKWVL